MVRVFFSPSYTCSNFAFDTTRKSGWIAESLINSPITGITLTEPVSLTQDQVEEVHHAKYVHAVATGRPRRLAESQSFPWSADLWQMVLASNGGVVAAVQAALNDGIAGSLSCGLHHARYSHGAGFCTFNGLVVAARAALAAGVKSVIILDLDAHCGGGTASLIEEESRIRTRDQWVNGPSSARRQSTQVSRRQLTCVLLGALYSSLATVTEFTSSRTTAASAAAARAASTT